jgi:L-threonylcarbamoyladenylate synthase
VTDASPEEFLIGFAEVAGDATLSAKADLIEAASNLFELLHRADQSAKPRIAVAPVPSSGIGVAINDRLRRAAS